MTCSRPALHRAWVAAERTMCAFAFVLLAPAIRAQRPNLLLIVADDLGVDCVGCYGAPSAPPTPTIDALAREGVRFTQFHVNPSCSPTRAAIFTGRHAFRGDCTSALAPGAPGLAASAVTIAAPLNDAGYETAMIGKWHLGGRYGAVTPAAYGWNHFEGVLDSGIANSWHWPKTTNGVTSECSTYAMTDQVDSAIRWIQARPGPWALALTTTLPHLPFHAPPANLHTQNLTDLDPATTPRPFQEAMIQAMDSELGRLLATLGPTVLANTNVVFLGDNGTDGAVALPPNGSNRSKGALFDSGSRVPLVIRGPAVTAPGRTAEELVGAVDLFPTLLRMCNAGQVADRTSAALPLDGASFSGALTGNRGYGRDFVYTEITHTPVGDGYAIRTATHKLIRYMQNRPQHQEFYDLVADPEERRDLLAGPMRADQLAAFRRLTDDLETVRDDGWGELHGRGCAGAAGEPLLRWQSQPRVGSVFWTYLSNFTANSDPRVMLIGLSDTTPMEARWALTPPTRRPGVGCELAVSLDAIGLVFDNGFGTAMPIPREPALYRSEFYVQALSYEPSAAPPGAVLSRGLRLVIGK